MRSAGGTLALVAAGVLTGSCTAIPHSAPPPARRSPPPPPPAPPIVDTLPRAEEEEFGPLQGNVTQGGLARGVAPERAVSLTLDGVPVSRAPDGTFLIAFGRDAAGTAVLEARLNDGRLNRQALTVTPRQWDIQSLPTLPKGTKPTPEFLRRREGELAQINAARRRHADSDGWRQRFMWPAIGRISGVYGSQRIYAGEPGSPHAGVDIARPAGTIVGAPADGVVVLAAAAPFTLEGNLLMIDHGMGLVSAFLHLSRIDVKPGQRVLRGQPVGAIGMTGRATGPHLHWAVSLGQTKIDPQLVAGPMPGG